MQQQLIRHCSGLAPSFADGIEGEATRDTLLRFQKAYGLSMDGLYGPETANALTMEVNGLC